MSSLPKYTKDDLYIQSQTHSNPNLALGTSLDPCELGLEAFNRGISYKTATEAHDKILAEIPNLGWQMNNIIWFGNLTQSEQQLVTEYINYGYEIVNSQLRRCPESSKIPINDLIAKSAPIPNDIIVYRYFRTTRSLDIPDSGEYVFLGYLSTSISASFVFKGPCISPSFHVMRIHVPKGAKGIYIPSNEYEIIFPHKSKLIINSKKTETIVCSIDCLDPSKSTKVVDVTMYDCTLILN